MNAIVRPAQLDELRLVAARYSSLAVEQDLAGGRPVQATEQVEQRRLAAARPAADRHAARPRRPPGRRRAARGPTCRPTDTRGPRSRASTIAAGGHRRSSIVRLPGSRRRRARPRRGRPRAAAARDPPARAPRRAPAAAAAGRPGRAPRTPRRPRGARRRRPARCGAPSRVLVRPSRMATVRRTWPETSGSWVTMTIVVPELVVDPAQQPEDLGRGRRCRARRSARRRAAPAGSLASATAMATRCCSPPDSRSGRWSRAVAEPDHLEQLAWPGRRRSRPAVEDHRQLDVLQRGQVRQQVARRLLPDEPDRAAPVARPVAPAEHARRSWPATIGSPGRRDVQAAEDVEQRRLAAARGADDGHHLAALGRPGRGPAGRRPRGRRPCRCGRGPRRRSGRHRRDARAGGGSSRRTAGRRSRACWEWSFEPSADGAGRDGPALEERPESDPEGGDGDDEERRWRGAGPAPD